MRSDARSIKGSFFQNNLKVRKSVWLILLLSSILALQQISQTALTLFAEPAQPRKNLALFEIRFARVIADEKLVGVDSIFQMHRDQVHFWSSQCLQGMKIHWYLNSQVMQVDSIPLQGGCFTFLSSQNARPGAWTVDVIYQEILLGTAGFTIREIL